MNTMERNTYPVTESCNTNPVQFQKVGDRVAWGIYGPQEQDAPPPPGKITAKT